MSELCCVCKKNIPYIHIEGDGDYCRDCHNKKMLDMFGVKNDFNYSDTIMVRDSYGTLHTFKVEHIILGSIVSWEAIETGGDYSFKVISGISDNGTEVAKRFFHKIAEGVNNKTLEESSFGQIYAKDKGNIHVVDNEITDWASTFVVDGVKLSAEEFVNLFSPYVGFNIQYRVCDSSEPLLGKDEYLVPVKITKAALLEELEYIIDVFSDNGFMDNKRISLFEAYFFKFIKKLDVFYENKRDEAKAAGNEMIDMLEKIEHDDDFFPGYEVQMIDEIITKYDYGS